MGYRAPDLPPLQQWILVLERIKNSSNPHAALVLKGEPYALGAMKKRTWGKTPTAWFSNCPEGMRKDGNWYVNTRENRIYLFSLTKPSTTSSLTVTPCFFEYLWIGICGEYS
jgi:hypothetical protein